MKILKDITKVSLSSKKYIFFHIALLISLIILDQISKYISLNFSESISRFNFFGFSLAKPLKNYNLIFGLDFGMEPLFILSYLTTIFCLFLFFYILSFIFIPKILKTLQLGVSLLFAGFTGNFISKVILSYNIDFITWSLTKHSALYFNLSDCFQTIGFFTILIQMFLFRKVLWKSQERRGQLIVIKNYQIQFIAYCTLAFACFCLFFTLLNYQFLGLISSFNFSNLETLSNSFLKYSLFSIFVFSLFLIMFFSYLSHKIYGPIYAFEKNIRALLKKEEVREFKLRKNDQFKQLESLAKDIKNEIEKFRKKGN